MVGLDPAGERAEVSARSPGSTWLVAAADTFMDSASILVMDTSLHPSQTPPQAPGRRYGLHMDQTYNGTASVRAAAIAAARSLEADVSRNSLNWAYIEPQRAQMDWRIPDAVVDDLNAAGIEPLLVLVGSPSWATGVPTTRHGYEFHVPTDELAFTNWLEAYRLWAREAALRYRGRVRLWELWNEPNEVYFWKPQPNVERYARWYTAVHQVIKEVDPEAEVAMGGLAGLVAGCCITGRDFLRGLWKLGVRPEIVNIHPYALKDQAPDQLIVGEGNFGDIASIRELMIAHGEGGAKLWVTEWGWRSSVVGETKQASYVSQSLALLDSLYTYVTLATYFIDSDRGGYTQGLFRSDFTPKAASHVFRDFMTRH